LIKHFCQSNRSRTKTKPCSMTWRNGLLCPRFQPALTSICLSSLSVRRGPRCHQTRVKSTHKEVSVYITTTIRNKKVQYLLQRHPNPYRRSPVTARTKILANTTVVSTTRTSSVYVSVTVAEKMYRYCVAKKANIAAARKHGPIALCPA